MAGTEGRDPYDDYVAIRKELESFSPKLLTKEEIIIANKMDGDKAGVLLLVSLYGLVACVCKRCGNVVYPCGKFFVKLV